MTITISEEILKQAGLSEKDALIEFACRLFDAQKLNIHQAAKLAAIGRYEMEAELAKRGLPVYRYTEEMLRQDLETLDHLELLRKEEKGTRP